MTIYDIDERIRALLDEETGEIKDYEEFENLQMERTEKIESVALWIKELKAEAKAIEDEIKNLGNRKEVALNKVERLKNYLIAAVKGAKFKTAKVVVTPRKSQSVEVDNWQDIPEDYLRYKDPEVNKIEISRILKQGGTVPGCHLKEVDSVTIK